MKQVKPKKDRSKGRWLGGFRLRFDFYTNGLIMTPDDNVSHELAEAISEGVRKVVQSQFRIVSNLPRLNPFKAKRVTRGSSTNVYGIFYDEIWQKEWGVFPTVGQVEAFIEEHRETFEEERRDPALFKIVKGVVRFSL